MSITEDIFLDAEPKWTVNIKFKKKCDKDEGISLQEFKKLEGCGWRLEDE